MRGVVRIRCTGMRIWIGRRMSSIGRRRASASRTSCPDPRTLAPTWYEVSAGRTYGRQSNHWTALRQRSQDLQRVQMHPGTILRSRSVRRLIGRGCWSTCAGSPATPGTPCRCRPGSNVTFSAPSFTSWMCSACRWKRAGRDPRGPWRGAPAGRTVRHPAAGCVVGGGGRGAADVGWLRRARGMPQVDCGVPQIDR